MEVARIFPQSKPARYGQVVLNSKISLKKWHFAKRRLPTQVASLQHHYIDLAIKEVMR